MAVGVTPGELRELTDDELKERLRESKEELFNLRFQMATGQLSNNRRLRTVRSRRLLSSCPVAIWKRRLNSSSLASRSRVSNSSS
jgi:ribosomal protein L29